MKRVKSLVFKGLAQISCQSQAIHLGNAGLVRQAIREDWPVPDDVRRAIIEELFQEVDSDCSDVRRFLAITRVIMAMSKANIDTSS